MYVYISLPFHQGLYDVGAGALRCCAINPGGPPAVATLLKGVKEDTCAAYGNPPLPWPCVVAAIDALANVSGLGLVGM